MRNVNSDSVHFNDQCVEITWSEDVSPSHMNLQLLSLNCVTPNRTTKSTEHVKQVQKLQIDTDRGFQNKPEKIGTVCDHLRLGTIIPVLTISSQLKPDAQEVIATRGVCVFSCGKFSCSGRRWVDDG